MQNEDGMYSFLGQCDLVTHLVGLLEYSLVLKPATDRNGKQGPFIRFIKKHHIFLCLHFTHVTA